MGNLNFDASADPTLEAVDAALVARQDREQRPYFGMSTAGGECQRQLWLRWRWVAREAMSAASLRAIEDGHRGEAVMAGRLRLVPGIALHTRDAEHRQFEVTAVDGHMKGHIDGAIQGLLQAPKTFHVWEHKQVNEKKFAALRKAKDEHGEKGALEKWDPVFFVQAQLYMHYTGMPRHYLTAGTPGVREALSCRTEYDAEKATAFEARARETIQSPEPPLRISEDPTFWLCRFCEFKDHCHGEAVPRVTCRSCAHSTPIAEGVWACERFGAEIPEDAQREGCDEHRFIPALFERVAELVEADAETNRVRWRNKITGKTFDQPGYTSGELAAARDFRVVGDDFVEEVKNVFGADSKIVSGAPVEQGDAPKSDLGVFYGEQDRAASAPRRTARRAAKA